MYNTIYTHACIDATRAANVRPHSFLDPGLKPGRRAWPDNLDLRLLNVHEVYLLWTQGYS